VWLYLYLAIQTGVLPTAGFVTLLCVLQLISPIEVDQTETLHNSHHLSI